MDWTTAAPASADRLGFTGRSPRRRPGSSTPATLWVG